MKVTVAIVTRGRPLGLIGVVMGFWRLRSQRHDVEFAIGLDDDDLESHIACHSLAREIPSLQWYRWPRMKTRGHIVNALVDKTRGADVLTIPTDWTFCLTPHWDDVLAQAAQQQSNRVLWWQSEQTPGNILPVLTRQWLDAADWIVSPALFPFWWDDTWLEEVDAMIGGASSYQVAASFAGEHGKTMRGRDFAFWADVFAQTRPQRIAQANSIAERLGLATPLDIDPRILAAFAARDKYQRDSADLFNETYGDSSPPSEQYFEAKTAALHLIPATAGAAA